jgi:hypothetical protein
MDMSRQEMYAWSSLATSVVLLAFYLTAVLGWPESIESYYDYLSGIFWKVLLIAVAVELILDLMESFQLGGVSKDERDIRIESKGYRNAYYLLVGAIALLLGHLFINDLITSATGNNLYLSVPFATFHILLVILLVSSIVKAGTQLYYYNKL